MVLGGVLYPCEGFFVTGFVLLNNKNEQLRAEPEMIKEGFRTVVKGSGFEFRNAVNV